MLDRAKGCLFSEAITTGDFSHMLGLVHRIVLRGKRCHLNGGLLGIYKNNECERAEGASRHGDPGASAAATLPKAPTTGQWDSGLGHTGGKSVNDLPKCTQPFLPRTSFLPH